MTDVATSSLASLLISEGAFLINVLPILLSKGSLDSLANCAIFNNLFLIFRGSFGRGGPK